jgi:putative membrane protein
MPNEARNSESAPSAVHTKADDGTRLALLRTVAALDRTLMAWVRTATSLISFGFTIYKVFQALLENESAAGGRLLGPRGLALVMIGLGIGGLLLGTFEYRRQMQVLHAEFPQFGPFRRSPAFAVAGSIVALGVLGLVLVMLRL